MGLGESLGLGYRALTWSANQQVPEEEQVSEKTMSVAVVVSMVLFSALFIVLPALAGGRLADVSFLSFLPFHLAEGVVRLGLFVGYLLAISRIPDIRRVFEYHGAEHKTIAAYENDVELTPESANRFTTAHVRCGTNFLLTVMVVAILVYTFIPTPNLLAIIVSRIVLIPVIAGLSYEVIRLSAKNMQRRWVRVLMKPGLWLQKLTTREPDLDATRGRDRLSARGAHRRAARGRGRASRGDRGAHRAGAGVRLIPTLSTISQACAATTRGTGPGTTNRPPHSAYSRCCSMISSAKFQASRSK